MENFNQPRAGKSRRALLNGLAAILTTSGMTSLAFQARAGTSSFKYDELGRVTQIANANGTTTYYFYDSNDSLIEVDTVPAGATLIRVTGGPANLRSLANAAGYAGASGANYQFVVPAGVTVTGSSGGGRGIDTGTWPSGCTLSLVVNGNVYGGGGTGGNGASYGGVPLTVGGNAGDAIYCQTSIAITVNGSGWIKGGGGGGSGGVYTIGFNYALAGGGGGGGFPNGPGGTPGTHGSGAGSDGVAGAAGTTAGGGLGGYSAGQNGGAAATAGNGYPTGGAAGYAVRKNGNTVTVTGSNVVGTQA